MGNVVLTLEMRAEMRRCAEAATHGPWLYGPLPSEDGTWTISLEPEGSGAAVVAEVFSEDDRDFIAASCPTNVIALLDEIDELRRERDAFRDMKPGRKSQRRQIMRLRHGDNAKAIEALCKAANDHRDRANRAESDLAALRFLAKEFRIGAKMAIDQVEAAESSDA